MALTALRIARSVTNLEGSGRRWTFFCRFYRQTGAGHGSSTRSLGRGAARHRADRGRRRAATYQKLSKTDARLIQPIAIYFMKGYWYCRAYDVDKRVYRVFRCDRITSAEAKDIQPLAELTEITMQNAHSLWRPSENAVQFKCLIDQRGVEYFQQEHYPSMRLINEMGNTYLVGSYEPNELDFIIKFLSGFGKSIKIMEPVILKEKLRQYYTDLLDSI